MGKEVKKYKCISKFKDENGFICKYTLENVDTGRCRHLNREQLLKFSQRKDIKIVNLVVPSNYNVCPKRPERKAKPSKTESLIKSLNNIHGIEFRVIENYGVHCRLESNLIEPVKIKVNVDYYSNGIYVEFNGCGDIQYNSYNNYEKSGTAIIVINNFIKSTKLNRRNKISELNDLISLNRYLNKTNCIGEPAEVNILYTLSKLGGLYNVDVKAGLKYLYNLNEKNRQYTVGLKKRLSQLISEGNEDILIDSTSTTQEIYNYMRYAIYYKILFNDARVSNPYSLQLFVDNNYSYINSI